MLIRGEFESGQHLQEIPLARQLNASRTPVRLALGALAQEGLLVHKPNSGFLVREFTIKEISDAVLIRGELEAVAARMVAEKGMSDGTAAALRETLDMASQLVSDGRITVERYSRWFDLNGAFHDLIVKETANATLSNAISQISKIPLVGAGVMAASIDNEDRINEVVAKSQAEHEAILQAMLNRQSLRAHALMYEHVYKSSVSMSDYLSKIRAADKDIALLKFVSTE